MPIRIPTQSPLPNSGWIGIAPRSEQSPDLAIVYVTKSLESTLAFIDLLAHSQGRLVLDLVICDVGKADVSELLFANRPNILYVRCANAAYSVAANHGLSLVTTNVVGFFAAQTLIESEALHRLFSSLSDQKGIIGPQLRYTDGRLKAAGGIVNSRKGAYGYGHLDSQPDHPRYKFARQVDFCPGGYLIKREILHELCRIQRKIPDLRDGTH